MNERIKIYPNVWKSKLKEWLIIPIIGSIAITLTKDYDDVIALRYLNIIEDFLISFTFWIVLGNGNAIIIYYIDKKWTWLEHTLKRVIIGLVVMLVYTTLASTIVLYSFIELYLDKDFLGIVNQQGIIGILWIPMLITTLVSFWLHGQGFLVAWRQSAIDVERLKTENLNSKFESLKSQINPHFLFNSLNALSALVYESQEDAVKFIHQLSSVYRYVLDHQNEELVPLSKELEFLKSYIHLHGIRFGDHFTVTLKDLDHVDSDSLIPPVTLQMLVENAIKHNEISKEHQLHIVIEKKNKTILIRNNCNQITTPKRDSTGLGLNNITARYALLSKKNVVIETKDNEFSVTIPILKIE